jgi:methylase of polypeptide subunit release factors
MTVETLYVLEKIFRTCDEEKIYMPSDDTYLFEEALLRETASINNINMLEIGSGSGYLSCKVCRENIYLISTDIDPYAIECTKNLLDLCGCVNYDVIICRSGLCIRDHSIDIVFSNPPYLPGYEDHRWSGGLSGVEIAEEIMFNSHRILRRGGSLLILLSSLGDLKRFLKRSLEYNFKIKTVKWIRKFFETLIVFKLEKYE